MQDAIRRVVVYTDASGWGGAEIALANLVGALDRRHKVVVAGQHRSIVDRIAASRPGTDAVELARVGPSSRGRTLLTLRRQIAALHPDVFHANLRAPWACQHELLAASTVRGVVTVAVEQLPLPIPARRSRMLKRVVDRRLHAHVAVSERSVQELSRITGRPIGSFRVVRNGVPDRPDLVTSARDEGAVIGTLAALVPRKRLDLLLRAAARIDASRVLLIGDGEQRQALEGLAGDLDLAGRVTFVTDAPDARALLPRMDLFVLPSRDEGFPLSIVEAMLAAVPVVATDVGGVAEAVLDGVTGLVVPPDDLDALTAAIGSLLADPSRRRALGQAGRRRALEQLTDVAMARAFESLYGELLRRRHG